MRPVFAILALLFAALAQAQRNVPQLVRDVAASRTDDSRPRHFVSDGRVAYFFARDDNGVDAREDDLHGIEPWRSDGTPAGTYMIKDMVPGSGSSHVVIDEGGIAAAYGRRAYFVADDGIHGAELWQSDGTEAGTKMVQDIAEGLASSYPSQLKTAGGRLFFAANDFEHGRELWMLEGESPALVYDLNPGPASSAPRDFTILRRSLLFFATHADTGRELWSLQLTEVPHPTLPDRSR